METRQTECYNGEWMGVGTTCDQCGMKWGRQPDSYGMAVWPDVASLADDFECQEYGSVRRISIWGFWYQDYLPNNNPTDAEFVLTIRANIPAEQSPTGFATPGQVIWSRTYQPGQFTAQQVSVAANVGFYRPTIDYFEYGVGNAYYKYSFDLYSREFVQQGGGTIYWLSVSAVPTDGSAYFGWVTTQQGQSASNAVWDEAGSWTRLWYPSGHYQYAGAPADMAFEIIGPSNNAVGACCDPMTGCMGEVTEDQCTGMWQGPGSTCGMCPPPFYMMMGACCRNDGTCMTTEPGGCYDGHWQGPGSSCGMCPPATGACCMPMGECMELNEGECWNSGGSFNGPGSSCLSMSCPRPMPICGNGICEPGEDGLCPDCLMMRMGACRLGPGECVQTTASACSGEWLGEGIDCQESEGPMGPCCLGPGVCMELTMRECMSRGGVAIASCGQGACPGGSLNNPIPPWEPWNCPVPQDCLPRGVFELGGPSGGSYEPNIAYGYVYSMTDPNNALFTKILDFPTGFNDIFTIDVNDVTLGAFGPGQAVDFVALLGHGVKEFRLRGISPLTDPEDGMIFPIKLAFNVPIAQFRMRPLITVDMDRNEKVDLADYSKLASAWSNDNCSSSDWCGDADIDRDGDVDIEDLAIFADYWLYH